MEQHSTPSRPDIYTSDPMPAEASAFALGRFSRSPESLRENMKWVAEHDPSKFFETFYFSYGHSSLSDLGVITTNISRCSHLAAIEVLNDQMWQGQEKSSRYQDLTQDSYVTPVPLQGHPHEPLFHRTIALLKRAYTRFQEPVYNTLCQRTPRPDSLSPEAYARTMNARTFDVLRYFLPLAGHTNLGQIITIRVLERQIRRLKASPVEELRWIGDRLRTMCAEEADHTWSTLTGQPAFTGAIAPMLAKHCTPSSYETQTLPALREAVADLLKHYTGLHNPARWPKTPRVTLLPPHSLEQEILTTLLYRVTHAPYRILLHFVTDIFSKDEKAQLLKLALQFRGPHDDLAHEFRSGYALTYDLLMDIGAWRDLHRHRRLQQIRQDFTPIHGFEVPPLLKTLNLNSQFSRVMECAHHNAIALNTIEPTIGTYLLPFATKVRCLLKMDWAALDYLAGIRTTPQEHWSYRDIAWTMRTLASRRHPELGAYLRGTDPSIEAPLTR